MAAAMKHVENTKATEMRRTHATTVDAITITSVSIGLDSVIPESIQKQQ